MKTINNILADYSRQYKRATEEFSIWRDKQIMRARGAQIKEPNLSYSGFEVNYAQLQNELNQFVLSKGFSDKQAGAINAFCYENYHSCFEDLIIKTGELVEFLDNFRKLD